MGISYRYAKNLAKLGSRMLIALLVLDTAYSLIHFIIFKAVFKDVIPSSFVPIESIITNLIFIIFISTLTVGMLLLSLYYFKNSRLGLLASILLCLEIIIKIIFVVYQFSTLLGNFDPVIIAKLTEIFDMTTSLLFISAFVIFNLFQYQLKKRSDIGFGQGFLPYTFGFFALVYPLINLLNIIGITFEGLPLGVQALIHMLSYVAAILEIIMFFDLLRRFDHFKALPEHDEDSIIDVKKIVEKKSNNKEIG